MAITVASLETNFNTYIRDTTTDTISAAERLQYATEATAWLLEETQTEQSDATYTLNYLDTVHEYKVTSSIADLMEGVDLRRAEADQYITWPRLSSNDIRQEIALESSESAYAIERRDRNAYLVINHESKYQAIGIEDCESLTANGTWAMDATAGDGNNLTLDEVEFKQGNASFNFDITVAQTANNRATLSLTDFDSLDLTDYESLTSWLFEVYIPDVTYHTGFTFYWGSSDSAYWSASVTTDVNGSAWVNGWNTVKVNWADATKTSTPDVAATVFFRVDYNYSASQGNATDYRFDYLRLVRPEKLTFYYTSSSVGVTSSSDSTKLYAFAATTNVPYFSGQYDNLKYAVAHKMASMAFYKMGLRDDAQLEEQAAFVALKRSQKLFPSSKTPEVKNFKVKGLNFNRRRR
jgi:hypothetical protein